MRSRATVQSCGLRPRSLIQPCPLEQTNPEALHWWFGKRGFPHKVSLTYRFTFSLSGLTKKLRIRFGFGETVSVEEPGSDALSLRALRFYKQAHSRTIQTSCANRLMRGAHHR